MDKAFWCPWLLGPLFRPVRPPGTSTDVFSGAFASGCLQSNAQEGPRASAGPRDKQFNFQHLPYMLSGQPRNPWSPTLPSTIRERGYSLPRRDTPCPEGIVFAQRGYSLPRGDTPCPEGILLAQRGYSLPRRETPCSEGILSAQPGKEPCPGPQSRFSPFWLQARAGPQKAIPQLLCSPHLPSLNLLGA